MVEDRYQKGTPAGVKRPGLKKVSTQEGEHAQTKFRPSPYQPPCPAGIQPSIPPVPPPPGGEPGFTELIQRILEQHETFKLILDQFTAIAESTGTAPKPQDTYYDTPMTAIAVATPLQPNSPDTISNATAVPPTPGYQAETIYATLQRFAPKITVIKTYPRKKRQVQAKLQDSILPGTAQTSIS